VVPKSVPLDAVRSTAERVVQLATAVYDGYGADVVWRETRKLSRTKPFKGDTSRRFPSRHLMATGEPLWIADFESDPVAIEHRLAPASPKVKAFLGVPILSEGKVLGALIAIDMKARPYDEAVRRHFEALASLLGDDYTRAKMALELEATAAQMREALDETARSERRLRLATRLAGIKVWELDHARQQAFRLNSRSSAGDYATAARTLWDPVHPEDLPQALAAWNAHLAGGPPFQAVHRHVRQDGGMHWVESAAEAVRDETGEVVGFVGAVRNIDKEKRNEQELIDARLAAEAANEAKSAFLATVSHEIRTPLNGILGMAQAMARDDLPPVQRERLQVVTNSSESLLAILDDVLDLSKIGAGKVELERLEFDAAAAVRAVQATFSAVAAAKGLALDVDISPTAEGVYLGDPSRLRQVIANLVSNAVKFTAAGRVLIRLNRAEGGLHLSVADTGIGIREDRQASLFDPFVQADSSTTRQYGGTGLGLTICREMTRLMGGDIALESAPGQGSTFSVTLPLTYLRAGGGETAAASPVSTPDLAIEGVRLLAAEDNAVNQLVLQTLLGQFGVQPHIVANGIDAVAAWRAEPWDLILMDAHMPQMDGVAATRAIRDEEARTGRARTPIIALTANALSHQASAYLDCGMDQVVAKPIQIGKLLDAIALALTPDADRRAGAA
jgi:signal transduction histidine kinase/ActR/RegA family two-component response regulator